MKHEMGHGTTRYKIMRGNKGWMVVDTQTGSAPQVDGQPAVGLSAETAWQFADRLNKRSTPDDSAT